MGAKALIVQWAAPAEAGFDRLLAYIEAENPDAARQLWHRVMVAIEHAAVYPELAPVIPDLGRSYRELLSVRPFRVVYRVEGRRLRILAVLRKEADFDPGRFLEP